MGEAPGNVFVCNDTPIFVYDDAYDQDAEDGTVEYHGCRLLRALALPRHPSTYSKHNEFFCQVGGELCVIEFDAGGNLLGFDDGNRVQLDLRYSDLEEMFPRTQV